MKELSGTPVLVTGATGFIGTLLVSRLVEAGASVCAIDKKGPQDKSKKITMFCGDILDAKAVEEIFAKAKPKIVFHLAAILRAKTPEEEKRMLETNVFGTMNLLRAAGNAKCARFINMSTSDVYGAKSAPSKEADERKPRTLYGASKMLAEDLCEYYSGASGLPVCTIRPFLVYGPGQTGDMLIPYAIRSALSGEEIKLLSPNSVRDPVFVDDLVEYLLSAAIKINAKFETVNAGTGKKYTAHEIVERICKISKSKSEIISSADGMSDFLVSDTTKQKRIFGFLPKTPFEEGIEKTINLSPAQKP